MLKDKSTQYIVVLYLLLFVIKVLYVYSADLMLPDTWELWDFKKHVNWGNFPFELIPYFLCGGLVVNTLKKDNAYGFFSLVFFLIYFLPNNSILSLSQANVFLYIQETIFSLLIFYLIFLYSSNVQQISNNISLKSLAKNQKFSRIMTFLTIFVCLILIYQVYSYNHFNFNLDLTAMYEVRGERAEYMEGIQDSALSYVLMIVSSTCSWLILVCLYYSIVSKKYLELSLCVITMLLQFTVSMEKSTLFVMLIVLFVVIFERRNKIKNLHIYFASTILVLFLICFYEYYSTGYSFVYYLIVRRTFYMPSYLTQVYYEYFSVNPKMWLTQDVLFIRNIARLIIPSSYEFGIVQTISNACYQGLIPSPNNGLFSEAYAQLGLLGTFVFPYVYCSIIKLFKKYASVFGTGVACMLLFKLVLTMLSVPILRSGSMIGLICFFFIAHYIQLKCKQRNEYRTKNKLSVK